MTINYFYSVEDVAEVLQVHTRTVYRLILQGKLKAIKVGSLWRIQDSELEDYIRRSKKNYATI